MYFPVIKLGAINVKLGNFYKILWIATGASCQQPEHVCFYFYVTDLDGNDLLSYWPALEECDTHTLQKWGSERPLGADYSKDAANNNQLDAALTSGDENSLSQPHRHRKGERSKEKCTLLFTLTILFLIVWIYLVQRGYLWQLICMFKV